MTIEERAEKAAALRISGGCNCAQAVAVALADQTGLPEDTLKQITAGFGGGMGTMEGTCGALVGAGVAAGLATGGSGTIQYTRAMITGFKEKCGAVACRDLKARVDGKVICSCEDCVRNAVRTYGELFIK